MNKSVTADSTSVWFTVCTMPLVVLCWSLISSIPSDIQRELPFSCHDKDGYTSERSSLLQKNISRAAYFPFIVPPVRCSPGTRTGCGACFIQKGPSPEPAIPATNYDSHELCRTSSETKYALSRLPQVRSTPVLFYALPFSHPLMVQFRHSGLLPGRATSYLQAYPGLIAQGPSPTRHWIFMPSRLMASALPSFSYCFLGNSLFQSHQNAVNAAK